MQQVTTYRAQGKEIGLCFLFKYDLNGNLKAFEVAEGNMNAEQVRWITRLSTDGQHTRFPAFENDFKAQWLNNADITAKFDITISPADLSFEAFYEAYAYKVKPELARKSWNKLSEADRIKAFNALPRYEAHVMQTGQSKQYPVYWINQKRWLDEYPEAPPVYKKEFAGKNFNPALKNLAAQKTNKQ